MNVYSETPPEQLNHRPITFYDINSRVESLLLRYQKYGTLIVAVDYDNTIFDYDNNGTDFSQVHDLLRRAKAVGCKIVIYTARHKSEFYLITEYCNDIRLEYDAINEDVIKLKLPTSGKIMYNIFLDDKAGLLEAFNILRTTIEIIEEQIKRKNKSEEMGNVNLMLVAEMANENSREYNILKFLEEMAEINEVSLKYLTKNEKYKPPIEKFHEELAHLELRLAVMKEMFGVEQTNAELAKKQNQIAARVEQKKANNL